MVIASDLAEIIFYAIEMIPEISKLHLESLRIYARLNFEQFSLILGGHRLMTAIQKWKKISDFSGWSPMANWYIMDIN